MKIKKLKILFLVPVLGVSLALASIPSKPVPKLPDNHIQAPLIPQAHSWSCGAAVMLSILTYWNLYDGNEASLYEWLNTTSDYGTDPLNMIKLAKEFGMKAELKTQQTFEDLEAGLKRGETVILDFQAWGDDDPPIDYSNRWEDGHYAILVAMDEHYLYFMDPSVIGRYGYIAKKGFVERWHDYEIRGNERVENVQMAMYLSSDETMGGFPGPLLRID